MRREKWAHLSLIRGKARTGDTEFSQCCPSAPLPRPAGRRPPRPSCRRSPGRPGAAPLPRGSCPAGRPPCRRWRPGVSGSSGRVPAQSTRCLCPASPPQGPRPPSARPPPPRQARTREASARTEACEGVGSGNGGIPNTDRPGTILFIFRKAPMVQNSKGRYTCIYSEKPLSHHCPQPAAPSLKATNGTVSHVSVPASNTSEQCLTQRRHPKYWLYGWKCEQLYLQLSPIIIQHPLYTIPNLVCLFDLII